MNKQITVTFEFDVDTQTVSKLNCFVDGVESKKKTTTKASTKSKETTLEEKPMITLETNKYQFNNRAVSDMELAWEDRIVIKYEKLDGAKIPTPIIGKDEAFDEQGTGNKLTKTNSVAYRGKANTILAEYGTEFELVPFKAGRWKLVSVSGGKPITYEEVVEQAEKIDVTILTDDTEEDNEIEEMTFSL